MKDKFYLTTTLPYVNAEPHLGHALEFVQADIVSRYHSDILDEEIFFNTGTDEHGSKVYRKAIEAGKDPQKYADENAARFKKLLLVLGVSDKVNFIRTTDPSHKASAQEFWRRCDKNGFIYKKPYKIKYCVGCELEKTDSELEDGRCQIHPNFEIEFIEEENYFFKLSAFGDKLLDLYKKYPDFIFPEYRGNEAKALIDRGLEDFSISRLKEKMPWGVPVPDDDKHVMYVWFDALVNYVSSLGWPKDNKKFEEFWGTTEKPNAIQIAGKDQVRQQAVMWQAMLMAAGLPTSRKIVIHGFINIGGQKMSKSLGNVADPIALAEEYGTDAIRYYLARHVHPFEDSDFTIERFKEAYNSDLANGLGNLVSRIMKMAVSNDIVFSYEPKENEDEKSLKEDLNKFDIASAISRVEKTIGLADAYIQKEEPFKKIKTDKEKAVNDISYLLSELFRVARMLKPFLPDTSEKILSLIKENKFPNKSLFLRI